MAHFAFSTKLAINASPREFSRVAYANLNDAELPPDFVANSVEQWFQIIPLGKSVFRNGEQVDFSHANLAKIIDIYSNYSTPLSIDFEHQTTSASQKTGPIKIAGYLKGLGLSTDGLWGLGKFTSEAVGLIRGGHYLFCSPVIQHDTVDRLTNKPAEISLWNVALTVNPYLDGQVPIKLSREEYMFDQNQDKAAAAQKAQASVGQPVYQQQPYAPPPPAPATAPAPEQGQPNHPPSQPPPAPPPAAAPQPQMNGAQIEAQLAQAVGVDVQTLISLLEQNKDDIVKVLKQSGPKLEQDCNERRKFMSTENKSGTPATTEQFNNEQFSALNKELELGKAQVIVLTKQVEALKGQVETYAKKEAEAEAAAQKAKVETKVEELLKTGFMLPAQKEAATQLFTDNWDKAAALFTTPLVAMSRQAGPDPKESFSSVDQLNDQQREAFTFFLGTCCKGDETAALKLTQQQFAKKTE